MIRLALAGMRLRIGLVASVGTILRLGLIAETQALGGVDMQHDGMVDILQVFKRRDQRVHIVALLHITVVKSERLEQIQFRSTRADGQDCRTCHRNPRRSTSHCR